MRTWLPRRGSAGGGGLSRSTTRDRRRALASETQRIVASMPVPAPMTLNGLISNIEQSRERRIHLVPIPDRLLGLVGVCGLWIKHRTQPFDVIFHAGRAETFHGQQIIFHELVHLWLDDADGVTDGELDELRGGLLLGMVERLIENGQVAARQDYGSHKEIRTEAAAARLHQLANAGEFIEDHTARRLVEDFTYPLGGSRELWNSRV